MEAWIPVINIGVFALYSGAYLLHIEWLKYMKDNEQRMPKYAIVRIRKTTHNFHLQFALFSFVPRKKWTLFTFTFSSPGESLRFVIRVFSETRKRALSPFKKRRSCNTKIITNMYDFFSFLMSETDVQNMRENRNLWSVDERRRKNGDKMGREDKVLINSVWRG